MPQPINGRNNWVTATAAPIPGEARQAANIITPAQDLMDRTQYLKTHVDALEADLSVSTNRLADKAVTAAKIADSSVATVALQDNAVSDAKLGSRTLSQSDLSDLNVTGTLSKFLGWLAGIIARITGESDWRTAPAASLKGLNTAKADKTYVDAQIAAINVGDLRYCDLVPVTLSVPAGGSVTLTTIRLATTGAVLVKRINTKIDATLQLRVVGNAGAFVSEATLGFTDFGAPGDVDVSGSGSLAPAVIGAPYAHGVVSLTVFNSTAAAVNLTAGGSWAVVLGY